MMESVKYSTGRMPRGFLFLLELRRALMEERYEDCGGLMRKAVRNQSFGPRIRMLLADPSLHPEMMD